MAERSGAIENQARDGASERSESSVGEEIGAPESTQGLNMGTVVSSELERFRAVSRSKRGFMGRILGTFPFLKGQGDFKRDSGILSRF